MDWSGRETPFCQEIRSPELSEGIGYNREEVASEGDAIKGRFTHLLDGLIFYLHEMTLSSLVIPIVLKFCLKPTELPWLSYVSAA